MTMEHVRFNAMKWHSFYEIDILLNGHIILLHAALRNHFRLWLGGITNLLRALGALPLIAEIAHGFAQHRVWTLGAQRPAE